METERAVELYQQYLTNYDSQSAIAIMPQFELSSGSTHPVAAMLHLEAADDFLRELFNSINSVRRWLSMIKAWLPIYESCSQDEQLELLLCHITPVSELVLAAPQALRGRMIFAAAAASNIVNNEFFTDDERLQYDHDKTHINIKLAQKVGSPWLAWPAFAQALGQVNPDSWSARTSNFRNAREHGHPRNIGLGLVNVITTKGVGKERRTGFGTLPAIPLHTVLECGIERHGAITTAYQALGALLQQQHLALTKGSAEEYLEPGFKAGK